jgi:hypothetical protein
MERQNSMTDERPVYTFSVFGGIYGVPFTMTLNGPEGERKAPAELARNWHRQIMEVAKGPYRNAVVESYYHEAEKEEQE